MRPSSCFCLSFCIIVCLWAGKGGALTPAPAPDCNSALISLLPCLDYVQGNVSAPPQNCCVGLGSVVKSNPICLCVLFNSSALPIQVNTTRALQLPALCSVTTPNPSLCGGSVVAPVQEPTPSPPVSTPVPPATAPTTPPTGTPPAGTPPKAAATTPVMAPSTSTPSVAPATPTTPSVAPSVAPGVSPSVAPVVAPSVAPAVAPSAPVPGPVSGVPASTPVSSPTPMVGTPVPSPMSTAPAKTPAGSMSSPPAPPPATSENYAAPIATASLLSVIFTVSGVLLLQL